MSELEPVAWRYEIQYGPEAEANYAWLYKGGEMVATMKTHHAVTLSSAQSAIAEREARIVELEALLKAAGESDNSLLSKLKVMRGVYAMQNEQYTSRALHNIITEFEASRAARSLMSKIGERNGE